ncbi:hypothetical protein GHO41_20370 [Pseudomonas sp. FSL R10-0399]|uniref:hypothetical protein n=1 Tax=Pseudomonas sp. FSL R10-0399 TaxID=2662194 RepID=UPI0012959E42|nr:hypothetical protein [Pseudomonas sp. FSL R10-0399]MQT59684.1 hypothetical protein [Pseudomonas sp. FSL R10-0399]
MDSAELLTTLRSNGAKHVYNNLLLDENIFLLKQLFPDDHAEKYHQFKIAASDALNVSTKNIAIVGSSKTGYSLTPDRNFARIRPDSDIDLVVVSKELFDILWSSHLNYKNSIEQSKKYSYSDVAKNIFRHFVSVSEDDMDSSMYIHFADWINRVGKLKKILEQQFKIKTTLEYRVYDSWNYVEQYHIAGLNALMEHHNESY